MKNITELHGRLQNFELLSKDNDRRVKKDNVANCEISHNSSLRRSSRGWFFDFRLSFGRRGENPEDDLRRQSRLRPLSQRLHALLRGNEFSRALQRLLPLSLDYGGALRLRTTTQTRGGGKVLRRQAVIFDRHTNIEAQRECFRRRTAFIFDNKMATE